MGVLRSRLAFLALAVLLASHGTFAARAKHLDLQHERSRSRSQWPGFYITIPKWMRFWEWWSQEEKAEALSHGLSGINLKSLPAMKEKGLVMEKGLSDVMGKGVKEGSEAASVDAGADASAEAGTGTDAGKEETNSILDVTMICGGAEIWSMLTASSSVTGVQNIKWQKMEAFKLDHVKEQELKVKVLEAEIQSLAELIAEGEAERRVQYMSPEQSRQLIEAALGPDSFGGLDTAQRSGCGSVRGGSIRAPRHAFRKSEPLFEAAAARLFDGAQFRLDGDGFLETCGELLPQENERSYCAQLCQRFKDTAQRLSDAGPGETSGNLDELLKQQDEKTRALAKARSEVTECNKAWVGLSALREHLGELKGAMNERFGIFQDAEMALDDAQWDLTDLEENLKEEEQTLAAALESLADAGVATGKASARLQDVTDKEKALRGRLQGMQGPLAHERAQFEAAKIADKTVVDLLSVVSATMVKMHIFANSAVVEPLTTLGLTPELNLDSPDVFTRDPASTSAGGLLQNSVDHLRSYCSATALPAFAAVKDEVDLEPLCEVGETGAIMAGLDKAVLTRMDLVKKNLIWVKSWLNPYRDNKKMTQERAQELVVLGEPKGFQEIISVYHGTQFFKYLRDWRHQGPHLQLLAQLKKMTQKLDEAVHQTEVEIEGLKADLADLVAAREKAVKELDELVEQQALEQQKKDEVEKAVLALKEGAARLSNELEQLEEAVRKAKADYDAAALKLVGAHQEGVSALPRGEESFAELEARGQEAELLISLIERSLARTEQAYEDSRAQLARLPK